MPLSLQQFMEEAGADLEAMNKRLKEAEEMFNKAANYYGEDPKKTSPDQFFTVLSSFMEAFKVRLQPCPCFVF